MSVSEFQLEGLIAASLKMDGNKTIDTSADGAQLGNETRGEWGNLWK